MQFTLLSILSVAILSSIVSSLELIESRALNLCSDSLSLTAEHFNVVFTPQNQSMALSLDGSSKITGYVIAELVLTVYGYTALRKILNPCDMSLDGLCPVRAGPLPMMSTNIKIPENVVAQIPRIAYSVPDLDASVRVYINSTETGQEITCIKAALSNGKSVYQSGVGWTTAIISGLGLAASAITSSLGYSKAATHITANVVSMFGFMQSQAMFGMTSVHMPPIVQSWTQNFQWSMGIIHIDFLERLCTWYQRATGGTPSSILSNLTVTSVHVVKRRSSDILQHDSPAEVILAAVMLLGIVLSVGFAGFRVIRLARESLTIHQNPAYLLYSNAPCLSRWGFLYVHYKATTYYFIIPSLAYTFLRAIFISLSQDAPVVQTVALLVIQSGMLVAVSVCRPWMNKKTNIYNISIMALNFINTVFLLFFADVFNQPGLVTGVMGVVFFVFNTAFILVLLILILIDSIYAILSKNPDIRYQPMQDDRESFVRSHSHLVTAELHALGATARGDTATSLYKALEQADEERLSPSRRKGSHGRLNEGHSSGDVTLHDRKSPTSAVDLSLPLFPSVGRGQEDRKVRRQSSSPM